MIGNSERSKQPEDTAELILGTAQFGMDYGIANRSGQPSQDRVVTILKAAYQNGISAFDTAPGYGDGTSESRIGQFLTSRGDPAVVITKLPSVRSRVEKENKGIKRCVTESLAGSLDRLGRQKVEGYLLHDETDLVLSNGEVLEVLHEQKKQGRVEQIGVSMYTPSLAEAVLQDYDIDILQVPMNVFDCRFEAIAAASDAAILARSVYLQGLFFLSPEQADHRVPGAGGLVHRLHSLARELGRSVSNLAVAFVRDNEHVDGIMIGVDSVEQLEENVELMASPPIREKIQDELQDVFSGLPKTIVNPVHW